MKMYYKGLITGVIVTSILASQIPSIASMVDVAFNKIKVTVNGTTVSGENILINGKTYVPLRAISEMLDKNVLWDGATSTASINDKIPADWSEVKVFEGDTTRDTEVFKVTGKECRITWEYLDDNIFNITAYETPDKYIGSIASTTKKGKEVTYFRHTGEFYFKISSMGKYKITIEQKP